MFEKTKTTEGCVGKAWKDIQKTENWVKKLIIAGLTNIIPIVRCKEDLENFCFQVDVSYQHDKITYKDNDTLYYIVNNVVKRELID